jgi:branched-chain amino acid transport system ATP-binding protein
LAWNIESHTMNPPVLTVNGLRAGYGRAEVLHGINLQAPKGSVITVIGPNGAGKSTLLNALMGVLPAQGVMTFNGQPIHGLSLEERVMLGIALVPEKRELFGSMSVEDNLVLGAFRQVRLNNPKWREQMDVVYELFPRLKERCKQASGTLSGGERQMLAVGRAMMSRPNLLMLDEPSLGLAPLVVKEIFRTINALRQTGVTTLLVEQNARAALEAADFAYVLEMGEIALSGPAKDLATDSRVIDTYLGAVRKKEPAAV